MKNLFITTCLIITIYYFPWVVLALLIIPTLLILHMIYVLDHLVDYSDFNLKNNTELAKSIFRWNLLARIIFLKGFENRDLKESVGKNGPEENQCFHYYTINNDATEQDQIKGVKKQWRELSKIYHPDKEIHDLSKEEQTKKFLDITSCRDKMIQIIKVKYV